MRKHALRILLLGALLATNVATAVVTKKPQAVRDLHYGEVLFHFYQEDYFTAITHLMAVQQQQLLQHHGEESELLLAGLELSYGLLNQSEQRFSKLLTEDSDKPLRNRVWYYLTKISHQRGMHDKAYAALQEIDGAGDPELQAELAVLNANIRMALGQNSQAAEALEDVRAPEGWAEYLTINRGIALLRSGDIKKGRALLDKLGTQRAANDELRALRDRANLGLGYELLRSGDPANARAYLNRVRLRGPFMQAAMLGAGWASAAQENYQDALTPWLTLIKLGSFDPPVQEAHLAVPYAFNQLGDQKRAIFYYDAAIKYYDSEQTEMESSRDSVKSESFLTMLDQVDTGLSGGWLQANAALNRVPAGRYLIDVLSGNDFQEQLKSYRDLGYLESLLNDWLDNIGIYYDMVDARRQAYAQRAPAISTRLQQQEAEKLQERWQSLQQRYQDQLISGDPLALASGTELQQWEKLQNVQQRLADLGDQPRLRNMQNRARWLKGILYWQIQSDYKTRSWEIKKALQAAESAVSDVGVKQGLVSQALNTAQAGFTGYDQRIDSLRQRILALLPSIQQARSESSEQIRQLALKELEIREQRLISYRNQARYALARSYDQLAQHGEQAP